MDLFKFKWCRALLQRVHRVIAKQQSKREQAHPVCLQKLRKSTKRWRTLINRMIKKQQVKHEQINRKQT